MRLCVTQEQAPFIEAVCGTAAHRGKQEEREACTRDTAPKRHGRAMGQVEHQQALGDDLHPCADGGHRQPGP